MGVTDLEKDPESHKARMDALEAEQAKKVKASNERRGIWVVNTGPGKGKSTAAFGMAIRAAGHGQKVGIVQFIKGTWKTGEQATFKRFPEIDHVVSGEGFTWKTKSRERDIAAAQRGWKAVCDMLEAAKADPESSYQLLVLDELHIALRYEYLPVDEVVRVLLDKPLHLSVVTTGRDAPAALIEAADTVTEMTCVRHAFERGIKARAGVDF